MAGFVDKCLAGARDDGLNPKALIAPHAGVIYSGPIAGSAYRSIARRADEITRVVLLGPPHRVSVPKFCVPAATAFRTPLGDIPIDADGIATTLTVPGVEQSDTPHAEEHSLEAHLPFLQRVLGDFTLVPVIVGGPSPAETDALLAALWGGPETLIVVSSDLSHYHAYDFGVLVAFLLGAGPANVSEMLPRRVRVSAMSVGYNVSMAIFGGTTPMIAAWLLERTHDDRSFVWYLIVAAAISLVFTLMLREGKGKPLPE